MKILITILSPPPQKKQIRKKLLNKRYFKHDFFVFNKLLKHIWLFVKNHKKNLNIFTLLFINDSFLLMLNTPCFIITGTMNLIQSLFSRYTGILRTQFSQMSYTIFFHTVYIYQYLFLTVYIRDRCPACGLQIQPDQNKVFAFFCEDYQY